MLISIVAMDMQYEIGKEGKIPWEIPEDRKFFKNVTFGHTVIMGRATQESLPNGYLGGRNNWVLTRQQRNGFFGPNASIQYFGKLEEVLRAAALETKDIYIIGGGEIYRQFMPYVSRQLITKIHGVFESDTCYPPDCVDLGWDLVRQEWLHQKVQDDRDVFVPVEFLTYERRPGFAALPLKPL